ncbi:hypothetical protein [Planosporangium mesophilum]|nr:hypothetical protein [Planosporangium mesophilum]
MNSRREDATYLRPSLSVDRILAADEAAHWLSMVKPSQREPG